MRIWRQHGGTIQLFPLAFGILALAVPAARAQEAADQSRAPIPAYHSPFASAADYGDDEDNSQSQPADTPPLAGARNLALSKFETSRSFWQPRFDLFATGDSNAEQRTGPSSWGTWTSFSGGTDLHYASGNTDLRLGYTGGIMYSDDGSNPNGVVQKLDFVDKVSFQRVAVTFIDQLNYLPEQSLGFGGLGGLLPSSNMTTGLGPGFTPDQSIVVGRGQSFANSYVTELDTYLTPRTSLVFSGGYSILRYSGDDLQNSWEMIGRAGYDYRLSPKDTVAVFYTYQGIRYATFQQSIDNHIAQVSYGRQVTGRLAFQIGAGPEVSVFQRSLSGLATNSTSIYWSMNTGVQYRLRRNQFAFAYNHQVSSGSGLLAGSVADLASGTVTRRMSRTFTSGITGGYSRNKGLSMGQKPMNQQYGYWYGGVSLSHPWGPVLGLTLSYQVQYQDSNLPFSIGSTPSTNLVRHLISVGFSWHQRPLHF